MFRLALTGHVFSCIKRALMGSSVIGRCAYPGVNKGIDMHVDICTVQIKPIGNVYLMNRAELQCSIARKPLLLLWAIRNTPGGAYARRCSPELLHKRIRDELFWRTTSSLHLSRMISINHYFADDTRTMHVPPASAPRYTRDTSRPHPSTPAPRISALSA